MASGQGFVSRLTWLRVLSSGFGVARYPQGTPMPEDCRRGVLYKTSAMKRLRKKVGRKRRPQPLELLDCKSLSLSLSHSCLAVEVQEPEGFRGFGFFVFRGLGTKVSVGFMGISGLGLRI